MKNPNGPSIGEKECWADTLADQQAQFNPCRDLTQTERKVVARQLLVRLDGAVAADDWDVAYAVAVEFTHQARCIRLSPTPEEARAAASGSMI
jgi:hypothetical protein